MLDSEIPSRDQGLRSRTRQNLVLDCESCPLGRISIFHTRNNEGFY